MAFLSRNTTEETEEHEVGGTSEATKGQVPDVYGQVHPIETPELVARKMDEFEKEVTMLMNDGSDLCTNLILAQRRCPEYLTDDFKLKFLQCEVYNADLAAKRYANYWNKRVEILGMDKAFEPFTIDTLSPDVFIALEAGVIHIIERKEKNQRNLIYIDYSNFHPGIDRHAFVIALWYLLHVIALEDDDCPRRGAIIIADAARFRFSQCDKALIKLIITSIKECLPVRLSAYHLCHPPTFVKFFIPIVFMFLAKRMRKRLLVHSGRTDTVLEELDSIYGFGAEHLPTELGGSHKLDIQNWLEKRRLLNDDRLRIPTMTAPSEGPYSMDSSKVCKASTATLDTVISEDDDSDSIEQIMNPHVKGSVVSLKSLQRGSFDGHQIEAVLREQEQEQLEQGNENRAAV